MSGAMTGMTKPIMLAVRNAIRVVPKMGNTKSFVVRATGVLTTLPVLEEVVLIWRVVRLPVASDVQETARLRRKEDRRQRMGVTVHDP